MSALKWSIRVVTALAAWCPLAAAGEDPERAILALERAWLDGLLRRDPAVFEQMLDDDLSQIGLAGERADKADFLRFFRGGDWNYLAAQLEEARVTVRGETAISTGRVGRTVRVGSRDITGPYAFTHVWVRRPTGWRVKHSHVTPVPQPTVARPLSGIRVLYRLRVKAEDEERFRDAWARVTRAAVEGAAGARGSLRARSEESPGVFVAVARWDSRDRWRAYREGPPLDLAAAAALGATSELLSMEVLEELTDLGNP